MSKSQTKLKHKVMIKKDKCKGCGLCIVYCPVKHLEFSAKLNKKGVKFAKEKKTNQCIGCGFCFDMCPECCIEVYEEK